MLFDMGDNRRSAVRIVASNVSRLLRMARHASRTDPDAPDRPPGSDAALSRASGVSRKTIQELREGRRAVAIDTLEALAKPYKLAAWQLLHPDIESTFDDAAPSAADRATATVLTAELVQSLKDVARIVERMDGLEGEDGETARPPDAESPGGAGDPPRPSRSPRKRSKA
jgi:transcriptional regulator with XRE-family HTH domain